MSVKFNFLPNIEMAVSEINIPLVLKVIWVFGYKLYFRGVTRDET